MSLLVIGGTSEGREIATALSPHLPVIYSLAGVTQQPSLPSGQLTIHSGGFGGLEGLQAFVKQKQIRALIDASHPFALAIKRNVDALNGLPVLRYHRSPWVPGPDDLWHSVSDLDKALALAISFKPKTVLLLVGARTLDRLPGDALNPSIRWLARSVEKTSNPTIESILERGPFTLEAETALIKREQIDLILCRNSGGETGQAKLVAARTAQVQIVMIDPPKLQSSSLHSSNLEETIAWGRNFARL